MPETFSADGKIIESGRPKRKRRNKKPLENEANAKLVPTQPFVKESEMPATISAGGEIIKSGRRKRKKRTKKPLDNEVNPSLVPIQPFVNESEMLATFSADGEIIESGRLKRKMRNKKPLENEANAKIVPIQPFVKESEMPETFSVDGKIIESDRSKRKKRNKKPLENEANPKPAIIQQSGKQPETPLNVPLGTQIPNDCGMSQQRGKSFRRTFVNRTFSKGNQTERELVTVTSTHTEQQQNMPMPTLSPLGRCLEMFPGMLEQQPRLSVPSQPFVKRSSMSSNVAQTSAPAVRQQRQFPAPTQQCNKRIEISSNISVGNQSSESFFPSRRDGKQLKRSFASQAQPKNKLAENERLAWTSTHLIQQQQQLAAWKYTPSILDTDPILEYLEPSPSLNVTNCIWRNTTYTQDAIAKNVLDALSQEVMPSYDKLGSLPPDILVLVFNCLPAADRIRAERVCKNWQRLIKLYGWTSFRVANDNTVTNRGWRHLDKLLDRCATHIKELDLHGQRIITCWAEILHRLPNLRHLALTHVNLFPKDVSTLADSYPKIKSLSFSDMGESTFDNISSLLGRCPNLEHVSFEKYWFNFASFSFDGLSPTVKSIEMSDDHYCMELFPEVKRRNIMIESLVLKCRYRLNEIELQQLMTLDISSLKYLDISLNQVTRLQFVDFIPQLSKLQGLEVHVVGSDGKNCLNEIIVGVSTTCVDLEHFGFYVECSLHTSKKTLNNLMNLSKLESLTLRSEDVRSRLHFDALFNKMTQEDKKALKYFNTDANIKPKEIVKALESCKTLRTILCESDGSIDYTEILQYFTASHQNEGEPSGPNDNRIAHLYFGFQRPENHVEHKWAKFYWRDNALPESPVVLKLRRSVLSEPPQFLGM